MVSPTLPVKQEASPEGEYRAKVLEVISRKLLKDREKLNNFKEQNIINDAFFMCVNAKYYSEEMLFKVKRNLVLEKTLRKLYRVYTGVEKLQLKEKLEKFFKEQGIL